MKIQEANIQWGAKLNLISMEFDRQIRKYNSEQKKGQHLVPMILDYLLTDSCSDEVINALFSAIEKVESGLSR